MHNGNKHWLSDYLSDLPLQQAKIDSLTTVIQDLRTNQQNIQKQIETVDKNATVWKRGKYRNFSFSKEKLEIVGFDAAIKSEWGAAITLGKTFYLHKTPILNNSSQRIYFCLL